MTPYRFCTQFLLTLLLTLAFTLPTRAADLPPTPLPRAHAHNDYQHPRPLLDALAHGFCSVEADVWLINGQLLVAHDKDKTTPTKTLESLYLAPLLQCSIQNNNRIYPNGPTLTLLVDIKSDPTSTYTTLHALLGKYSSILSSCEDGVVTERAVKVIVSGNRPRELMQSQPKRLAFYDGRLEDLDAPTPAPASFMPLVSADWRKTFTWTGAGPLPPADKEKLLSLVQRAHAQQKRLRFWSHPDHELAWRELLTADVDLLNTDRLPDLRRFLSTP